MSPRARPSAINDLAPTGIPASTYSTENHAVETGRTPLRYLYVALIPALTAIVLLFNFQNLETVTVSFLTGSVTLPVSVLIILVYVIGMDRGGLVLGLHADPGIREQKRKA